MMEVSQCRIVVNVEVLLYCNTTPLSINVLL